MGKSDPGVVIVRPFTLDDLDAAVEFCARAREEDPSIEPFGQRLQVIATGPRALLELWRVAEGEDGLLHGLSFAAVREQRAAPAPVATAAAVPAPAAPGLPDQPLRVPAIRGPAQKSVTAGAPMTGRAAAAPGLVFAGTPPAAQAPVRAGAVLAQETATRAANAPPAPFPVAPSERTFTAPPPVPELSEKRGLRRVPVAKARTGPLSPEELGQTVPLLRPPPVEKTGPAQQAAAASEREPHSAPEGEPVDERTTLEVYTAVSPALRRQGLGRALTEGALAFAESAPGPVTLRARMRDGEGAASVSARAFLEALGFAQVTAQLSLSWRSPVPPPPPVVQGLQLRVLRAADKKGLYDLERLAEAAWAGAPDSFATRADELAQMLEELERIVLLASVQDGSGSKAAGYLSAVWLGKTLGIEEVAVLPAFRRAGVGRALVESALSRGATAAVLSVSEENRAARALYRGLGFSQSARKLIWERRSGAGA